MNLIMFCAIVLIPTSLAFVVKFYEVNLVRNRISSNPQLLNPLLVCTQHRFMYERDDNFTIYLELNNTRAPAVTNAIAVVKHYPGSRFNETLINFFEHAVLIDGHLTQDRIIIDVELITENGCQRETILEGTRRDEEPEPLEFMNKTTANDICLNGKKCYAIVFAADTCRDTKPEECQIWKNSNPSITTVAPLDKCQKCSDGYYEELNTMASLNILDTTTFSQKITGSQSTTETPKRDISDTQNAIDSSKDAETSYFTVMIVSSSIAAVTLVSLLIISIRYFCWNKYNSPGLQQIVPINENRYYENTLFGPDCLQEINQLEQRASDRLPPEPHYEEINNYMNHG